MRNTKNRTSRLGSAGVAVLSVGFAFGAWGFLNGGNREPNMGPANFVAKEASATKASTGEKLREQELGEAKAAKRKDGEKESNVLLNDPFVQNKWGLEKTFASKAWEITKGSKDIVVAVIDTGIDVNHKDLEENLWENKGETGVVGADSCKASKEGDAKKCQEMVSFCATQKKPLENDRCNKAKNGFDDDGNGLVDDVHGWNFVHANNQLTDNHGHGTHIAGIVGARGGNGFGISGVAPNVSLMILKYYDPKASNSNNLKNTVAAIRYAIQQKAQIINYSGGGVDYSAEEFAAIKDAERAGILFIAAAGNERSNSDEAGKHYYPADYELSNIISVTAVKDRKNEREDYKVLDSSNYGVRTVDLAAPGEGIYSTLPNNAFGVMTGTSQATAFVTGVAALVMAHNREFTAADVRKYILRTGDEYQSLQSKTGTAKLLNSYKALTSLDVGVSLTGVIATNTAGIKAFKSDQDLKDPKFNTSALSSGTDDSEEPAEAIALFSKEFLKVMKRGEPAAELKRR